MGTNIMVNQVKTPIQNYFEKVLYENLTFEIPPLWFFRVVEVKLLFMLLIKVCIAYKHIPIAIVLQWAFTNYCNCVCANKIMSIVYFDVSVSMVNVSVYWRNLNYIRK
jgi:hypothetical protein